MDFKTLKITLNRHDTGLTEGCLPAYIEVQLGYNPKTKDKGNLVLDLGNYIYRELGLSYQMIPEYRGRGKKTTLRWFMSKKNFEPIRLNVIKSYMSENIEKAERMFKIEGYIPFEFSSMVIQKGDKS